jgi:hypothetical protein
MRNSIGVQFIALVLLLATTLQPNATFNATWERPGVARLTWAQPADNTRACLVRQPASGQAVALDCYSNIPAGAQVVVLLGATAPVDGNYRPQVNDTYRLQIGNTVAYATLRAVVRLPVMLH